MAVAENSNNNGDLGELLKPFNKRASEAEERLAKVEAVLASKKGESDTNEKSSIVRDLQLKLEVAQNELIAQQAEGDKVGFKSLEESRKLAAENAKLKYRIIHLVRALKEADRKLGELVQVKKSQQ